MEGLKEAIEFITNLKEGSMEPRCLKSTVIHTVIKI